MSKGQNLAVDTILIPSLSLCDFQNKDVQVVLHNTTAQSIDFSITPTLINLEVWDSANMQTVQHPLTTGLIAGNSYDTITVLKMNFPGGNMVQGGTTYSIRAWIDKIDGSQGDDTTHRIMVINPDISIEVIPISDSINRLPRIANVHQVVIISNKGNFDVWDIPVYLDINHSGTTIRLADTLLGKFPAGTYRYLTFMSYPVPDNSTYTVCGRAELACDAYSADNYNCATEYVDLDDIGVTALVNPFGSDFGTVGEEIDLTVQLTKYSNKSYPSVGIHAQIIEDNGTLTQNLTGTITNFVAQGTRNYIFTPPYIVPDVMEYTIKIFIDSVDKNQSNDTLVKRRMTTCCSVTDISGAGFVLGQNSPNPAKENTRIAYAIPSGGEVMFCVYNIAGQTLYAKTVEAEAGNHSLEFDAGTLASGIYYYSMKFKGQQIVKKMNVQK